MSVNEFRSFDDTYAATKHIKQGKARLAPPFLELSAWIEATWHVRVLNAMHDQINGIPRLRVVVEHEHELETFYRNFKADTMKQEAIASKFVELVSREQPPRFDVNGLFVVFSAFATVARQEADSRVHDEEVRALQERIANPDLWVISRSYGHVTFMFYTDEQAQRYAAVGDKERYAAMYLALLRPHDEFGYLSQAGFAVRFDSKENLDKNYEGNWYHYYH